MSTRPIKQIPGIHPRADWDRKRCVYCESPKRTKESQEHIWAKWVQELVPPVSTNKTEHHLMDVHDGVQRRSMGREFTGDPLSRRLDITCKSCNTGWMAQLQEQAKPVVRRVILAEADELTPDEQRIVSTWAVMTTMNHEFRDPRTVSISAKERNFLRTMGMPADTFHVWIARFSGDSSAVAHHDSFAEGEYARSDENRIVPATQATAFTLGRAAFYVVSCDPRSNLHGLIRDTAFAAHYGLTPVWPVSAE